MMFKHGNSSAFWVGCSLPNMSFTQGLKGIGGGCTVGAIAMCITTFILSAVGVVWKETQICLVNQRNQKSTSLSQFATFL